MLRSRPRRAAMGRSAGFTLIEIMVVVVILGLLAGLVVPNVVHSAHTARCTKAATDCATIAAAARQFLVEKGRLPALEELVRREHGRSYLEKIPADPWGTDYVLRAGPERGGFR